MLDRFSFACICFDLEDCNVTSLKGQLGIFVGRVCKRLSSEQPLMEPRDIGKDKLTLAVPLILHMHVSLFIRPAQLAIGSEEKGSENLLPKVNTFNHISTRRLQHVRPPTKYATPFSCSVKKS